MAIKSYSKREKKATNEISYEVIKNFGQLDSDSSMPKELRLIKWGDSDPKYDIRGWKTTDTGVERMTKGITFDAEELTSLYYILKEMMDGDDE